MDDKLIDHPGHVDCKRHYGLIRDNLNEFWRKSINREFPVNGADEMQRFSLSMENQFLKIGKID